MLVVLGIILLAFVLFVTELFPVDVTSLIILVVLMVFGHWTHVSPTEGLSGFSNEATITVLAMLILSESVRQTGAVQLLGHRVAGVVGDSQFRQVFATVGIAGSVSGFINDTPVVALLVPFASDLAHRGNTSPSKLMIPLSYAAMLGGTLTLIGTSTNLLASGLAQQLLGRSLGIFQFTPVGVVVLITGALYLVFIAPRLLPERVRPRETLLEEYEVEEYLAELVAPENSPLVGTPIADVPTEAGFGGEVKEVVREDTVLSPFSSKPVEPDDLFLITASRPDLTSLIEAEALNPLPTVGREPAVTEEMPDDGAESVLIEVVVPTDSALIGETIATSTTLRRYDATLVALQRGDVRLPRVREAEFTVGDLLLLQLPADELERVAETRDLIVARELPREDYRYDKIPVAIAILAAVVGLAALGFLEIQVAALAGVVAMVLSGTLSPTELYEGVDWTVIFLLAGVIPLGIAMENTGTAAFLGALVATSSRFLPTIAVLGVFYVTTVVLTNIISNNATVALMVPVAINAAREIGVNPLAFLLSVMFAASAAFMSPVGYQTNLFVYGPGGYRFTDFARVGVWLQIILAIVTPITIALYFGL
ncbi:MULTISPECIES: SLC13 family permease [unclassified Haladaptatus]|uniref:SLC13 family permease n=1 Tax=unclassified Haladaptatus TaxID=2622732 RepID=UPI00209BF12E|nr:MULTISPECIES: SLC13 family permease [unclassified Haladaptatus]MCO8246029.1 SLC13 family permease [Haladaptatus sp. AB643]MCO8254350.1 SLC13 family permease [Haladaptatus sp. AB618]